MHNTCYKLSETNQTQQMKCSYNSVWWEWRSLKEIGGGGDNIQQQLDKCEGGGTMTVLKVRRVTWKQPVLDLNKYRHVKRKRRARGRSID